jgi:uncharacterized coiled-coil DUF342 family protein
VSIANEVYSAKSERARELVRATAACAELCDRSEELENRIDRLKRELSDKQEEMAKLSEERKNAMAALAGLVDKGTLVPTVKP